MREASVWRPSVSFVLSCSPALSCMKAKVAIEPDLECGAFIENEIMSGFERCHGAIRCSYTRSSGGAALAAIVCSLGRSFARANNDSFSNLFLAHSLTADFSFFADLAQSMFSRNSRNRCNQRYPSVAGVDLVEAQ